VPPSASNQAPAKGASNQAPVKTLASALGEVLTQTPMAKILMVGVRETKQEKFLRKKLRPSNNILKISELQVKKIGLP